MSNDWTNKLRNRLADYQEPVREDLWAAIEQSLAQHDETSYVEKPIHTERTVKKSYQVFLRRFSMAAALAAVAVGGTYVYLHPWNSKELSKVIIKKAKNGTPNGYGRFYIPMEAVLDTNIPAVDKSLVALASEDKEKIISTVDTTLVEKIETAQAEEVLSHSIGTPPVPRQKVGYRSADNSFVEETSGLPRKSMSKRHSAMSVKLYGENCMIGNCSGHNYGLAVGATQNCPTFMGEGDASLMSYNTLLYAKEFENFSGTNYTEKVKHHQPLSVGLSVGIPLSARIKLTTGLVYTKVSSDFISISGSNQYVTTQNLHYVGIPLDLSYEVWGTKRFHTYVTVGGEGNYNIKNDTESDGQQTSSQRDRMQWSIHGAVGVQYDIISQLGIYVEPGVKNYFDNGSKVENVFKEKKVNFNFQFGFRWNIGEPK